jgi:hypothetical protein
LGMWIRFIRLGTGTGGSCEHGNELSGSIKCRNIF